MKTKTLVVLNIFLIISQISIYGFYNDEGIQDSSANETQVSLYTGYVISAKITDAHGNHGTTDAAVEGIDIKQEWEIGINARFSLIKFLDIETDLLYSKALFPEQQVILQGFYINQPKSDLHFFTISVGPCFRYKEKGIWQVLNPYTSLSFTVLIGYVTDVNLSPYGKGGYSAVTGIGFNAHLGTQYCIDNFILSAEYRFEYLNSKVYFFRSFTEGLSFIKSSSYLLLGLGYSF